MWEWHSLGHVSLAESYSKRRCGDESLRLLSHQLPAVNSQGEFLLSGRNTWALYEVNPSSGGDRYGGLGGRKSTFTLGAGVPFAYQHNAEWLGSDEVSCSTTRARRR